MEYVVIALVVFCIILMIGVLYYKYERDELKSVRDFNEDQIEDLINQADVLRLKLGEMKNLLARAENKLSNQNTAKQVKAYIFGKRDEHLTYASIQQASYMTGISRSTIRRRIVDGKPHYSSKLKIGLTFKH